MSWKNRFYAMGMHILFSLFLLFVALFLVFGLWYPDPLQKAMGVTHIFWLILTIDLILGPLLTFVIFNPAKTELKRDLLIIVLIQIAAYIYGLHTVAQGRPAWQVFVIDDIELVAPIDVKKEESQASFKSEFQDQFFSKPLWVAAVYSSDPKIAQQQKQDEMFGGGSLAARPETFQPLAHRKPQIAKKLKKVGQLNQFNPPERVQNILTKYSNIHGWLPVKGPAQDMVLLIDHDINVIAIVDLRPWH